MKSEFVRPGDDLVQVAIAEEARSKERQVIVALLLFVSVLIYGVIYGTVDLAPDDGSDVVPPACIVELDHPREVPVISEGNGSLANRGSLPSQITNVCESIEQ